MPILGRPHIPIPKIIMEIGSELYPGIPGLRIPHDIIARRLSPPYKKENFEKGGWCNWHGAHDLKIGYKIVCIRLLVCVWIEKAKVRCGYLANFASSDAILHICWLPGLMRKLPNASFLCIEKAGHRMR